MSGEVRNQDYKLMFDQSDEKAKVDLVKNLVAMANAGGGQVVYGRDETRTPGVDQSACTTLDSARIADLIERYTSLAPFHVSHNIEDLGGGRFIVTLTIDAALYPIVMARTGDWKGMTSGKDKPLFLAGDVWTRHSTKTERVNYDDLRQWFERVRQEERERLLSRITSVVNLPEGAEIQVVSSQQQPIDSPQRLLEYAAMRHEYDPSHLLTSSDLAHIFVNRGGLTQLSRAQIGLLISSALRRPPTLYWWLLLAEDAPDFIVAELKGCLIAKDRDKSDAARSIIEMAAIFADDAELIKMLEELRNSGYQRFREAAQDWQSRAALLDQLGERVASGKHDGKLLLDYSVDELEKIATEFALKLRDNAKTSDSRKLADLTRVVWSKKSQFAHKLRST
jgi:hypothetical protein